MQVQQRGASLPQIARKRVSTEPTVKKQRFSYLIGQRRRYYCHRVDPKQSAVNLTLDKQAPSYPHNDPLERKDKVKPVNNSIQVSSHRKIDVRDDEISKKTAQNGQPQKRVVTHNKDRASQASLSREKNKEKEPFTQAPTLVLSSAESYYHKQIRERPSNRSKMLQFLSLLKIDNPLFQRVSQVISQALFKLGFVVTYQQRDLIYKTGVPIRNIGILLWGQLLYKKKRTKLKISSYPGSGVGEELIFEQIGRHSRCVSVDNGQFRTTETCRAVGGCGIVFIGEREYLWMREELAAKGMKEVVQCFERIVQRAYLRKREERLIYG